MALDMNARRRETAPVFLRGEPTEVVDPVMRSAEGYRGAALPASPSPTAALKPSTSLDDYVADPVGKYVAGPTYLVWYKNARLSGMVFWGRPEPEQVACVIRAIDINAEGGPRASLVDVRGVESVARPAFELLAHYVQSNTEKLRRRLSAQALVRPDGLVGVTVAGFYRVLGHPHPVEVFTDPYQALTWLGAGDQSPVILEVDKLVAAAGNAASIVRAIQAHFLRNPSRHLSLDEVAARLGISPRALQRELRKAKTSFQAEQNRAQVHYAKSLMLNTSRDIKQVAFEVGCSSPSSFDVLFRRVEGESLSAWRNRIRSEGSA
jgi:AraC-like DNA-binding protein